MRRLLSDRYPAYAASAGLHLIVLLAGVIAWPWMAPTKIMTVTPVTLVTRAEVTDLRAAEKAETKWQDPESRTEAEHIDALGYHVFENGVNVDDAAGLLAAIRQTRVFDASLFLSQAEFDADPLAVDAPGLFGQVGAVAQHRAVAGHALDPLGHCGRARRPRCSAGRRSRRCPG